MLQELLYTRIVRKGAPGALLPELFKRVLQVPFLPELLKGGAQGVLLHQNCKKELQEPFLLELLKRVLQESFYQNC